MTSRRFDQELKGAPRGEELGRAFVKRFGSEDLEMIASAIAEIINSAETREAFLGAIRLAAASEPLKGNSVEQCSDERA